MRIVVLGAGGAHRTEASIARAARSLGHPCRVVDVVRWQRLFRSWSGGIIRYLAEEFEPDFLILTRKALGLSPATLDGLVRRREAAFWYFDARPTGEVLDLGRRAGRMFITYLAQVENYQAAGINDVKFLPQGVDPWWDRPADSAPPSYECDTSFVGSGQYPYRHVVLRAAASVSRLQIRGPGWDDAPADLPVVGGPVFGRRFARVIRGAAISLGASAYPEQDTDRASTSNRMWKVLGCGGFFLGGYVPDIESFAVDGQHCAWYRDPQHAAELIRHYLAHPTERERIARAGRAHALAHHTYAHRLEMLLRGQGYPVAAQTIL